MRLVLTQIKKKLQSGTAPQDILLLMRSTSDYPGLARAFALYGLKPPCLRLLARPANPCRT